MTKHLCDKCGSEISLTAPLGLCSVCLLKTGLGLMEETPARPEDAGTASPPLEFHDYELLEEIGRGGQGIVYRARQKSLNRTVALKVIGIGRWADESHLKRFRLEAEAAARLSHPNIVPIHDIGERQGYCYFSMNLIEGGQLDEFSRNEEISIQRRAEIIVRLARTVHYAHEHGILHRDIKPGNVLLDAEGEPHLADFGLARLVETDSDVTRTSDVLGTPSYLAPEQARGDHFSLTHSTDVYGLGAVFYYLLTGSPPFAGPTPYETVRQVLETEPQSPRIVNPKVDHDLSTICLKCLEKDPRRRYSSALALAEDLERWLKHEPIQARPTGPLGHGKKWLQRNPATALSITLAAALLTAVVVIVWKSKFVPPPLTNGIAVLPFVNLSEDKQNAFLADGVQDEILTNLTKISNLKVISRTSVMGYRETAGRNLRKIGQELGVAHVLEGSVQRASNHVRVNAKLIDTRTDSHLWAQTYDRDLADVFSIQSEIAKRIAESLQAKLTDREERALAVKPTDNPEAYEAYLRGLSFEARGPLLGASSENAGFYERAVQLDPLFAIAWARLSRTDANIYFNTETDTTRRDGAKRALENAQRLAPNSSETLLALGYYQYWIQRDYWRANTTFERVRKAAPGNSEVAEALALLARRQGHAKESIAYFEQALALDPRNVELLIGSGWTCAMSRQFPAALKLYNRALDISPNDPDVMAAKASICQAQGNLQEAANLLSGINEQTPDEDTFRIKITQLRLERDYYNAIRLLQARLIKSNFDFIYDRDRDRTILASIQRLEGDTARAKVTAEDARNTLEPLSKAQPNNSYFAGVLPDAYAAMGDKDSALKEARRATMLLPDANDPIAAPTAQETLASIQAAFGENAPAISTLTELLQKPYMSMLYRPAVVTPALLRLDPVWDGLRGDAAFQKLCEQRQP